MDKEELEWLKEFLDEHKNLVTNKEYKQLYADAYNTADEANDYSLIGNLTYVLYKTGIYPLYKMDIAIEYFAAFTDITEYTVPSNIGAIDKSAFAYCKNLERINLVSGNLTLIGSSAFKYCEKLKEVKIPEGVKTIDTYAFTRCKGLKKVYLPSTLELIGMFAFSQCPIKDIYYDGTADQWNNMERKVSWVHSTQVAGFEITVHCIDGDLVI